MPVVVTTNSVSGVASITSDSTSAVQFYNSAGTETLGSINVDSINGGPIGGTRNRIINGAMAIDQRNSGASQTFTAGGALAYSVDRWYGYCTGANVTGIQTTTVGVSTGGLYAYRFTGAASVTGIGFGQRIESKNSADLAGGSATLSVDLANTVLTGVGWTVYYANGVDTFGTLASPNRTQISSGTFTVNSTLTRYSSVISIPAAATTGIEIVFTVGAQTSGTWTIGNVQLEAGTVATPFERRSYGQELALCQRYYETICVGPGLPFFGISSTQSRGQGVKFAVTKRVSPTMGQLSAFPWTYWNGSADVTLAGVGLVANRDGWSPTTQSSSAGQYTAMAPSSGSFTYDVNPVYASAEL